MTGTKIPNTRNPSTLRITKNPEKCTFPDMLAVLLTADVTVVEGILVEEDVIDAMGDVVSE